MFMITVFIGLIALEGLISAYLLRFVKNPLYVSSIGALMAGIVALPFTYKYFNIPSIYTTVVWSIFSLVISIILNTVAERLGEEDELKHIIRQSSIWVVILTLFIIAPLSEEIIFRGILLVGLVEIMPLSVAIIVDGLIFSLVHIGAYWENSTAYKLIHLIGIFILGSMLAYTFSVYHSLTLNAIAHAVANIPGLIFVYKEKE